MFQHSSKLQYKVRVDAPDPVIAKYLQQAIGGVEGEIRVAMIQDVRSGYTDDGTIRGTVDKAANALRDMVTDLGEDASPFIRQGEEQLLAIYESALERWPATEAPDAREVAARQASKIRSRMSELLKNEADSQRLQDVKTSGPVGRTWSYPSLGRTIATVRPASGEPLDEMSCS